MRVNEMRAYLVKVPCFRDLNERYLGEPLAQLADELTVEQVRAKAVRIGAGWILPKQAA